MGENDYILASEISEYIYCKRGWQIIASKQQLEVEPENKGIFKQVQLMRNRLYLSWFFTGLGIAIMIGIIFFF